MLTVWIMMCCVIILHMLYRREYGSYHSEAFMYITLICIIGSIIK